MANGYALVRTLVGYELDVAAIASDQISQGAPLLTDVYADAVEGYGICGHVDGNLSR